jgi:hypothetical protein
MHRTTILVPLDDWSAFEKVAKAKHMDRASMIRQFIEKQVEHAKADES